MLTMEKFFKSISVLLLLLAANGPLYAQDNAFDELAMNGLASFEQLRKEYYIGALYLESMSQDSDAVFDMNGKKRMEMRITIADWSPRRFAQQWNQAILINNDQQALEEFSEQILAFTNIPHEELTAGDRIIIDMDPDRGTTIYLDGQKVFKTANNAFFKLLLNTWIGPRPPSSGFKQDILSLPTDQAGTELLVEFSDISTPKAREKQVAAWMKPAQGNKKAAAVAATAAVTKSAVTPPPSMDTVVSAKTTPKTTSKPKQAQKVETAKVEAPKAEVKVEQPKLAAAPAPAVAAEPKKSEAKKPEPKKVEPVKKEPAKPKEPEKTPEEIEQETLYKTYRSNILKLTYLNTQYPKKAMDLKQQGMVILKITINSRGKVVNIDEQQTTEYSLLNKAAMRAVKKSSPFPEPPKGLDGKRFEFTLPFKFQI